MPTTAHSPNRKERPPRDPAKSKRNPWRANAKSTAIETKKQRTVNGVAVGMTRDEAALAAGMSPAGLKKLLKTHPGLEEKLKNAEEEFEEQCKIAKGELASRIVRITSRVGETVLTTKNEKIVVSGGLAIMRGCGVLAEKPVAEEKGANSNPERVLIVNIIGNPEARQAAITLARAIEIQEAQEHENT